MLRNRKVLIFSGGTGGHVIPAINLANFLIKKNCECSVVIDKRGEKYIKNFNGKIFIINSSHLSGGIFFKIQSIIKLIIGFFQSLILIIKLKPSKCISFGSYATFTPILSILILKKIMRIKLYMHEQNSVIGKVNLFFLSYAENIFTNFEDLKNINKKFVKKKIYVGFPNKNISIKNSNKLLIKKNKKIIFIYGGSQGSVSIINNFIAIIKKFDTETLNKIKLIIQSPKQLFNFLDRSLENLGLEYEIKEFYNNIDEILSITDIAITRAGAGTINDLISHQIPSIIFPLPHSINNHQLFNAKYLADKKAALLMDEKNFKVDISSDILRNLIYDSEKKILMKKALNEIEFVNQNETIFKKIFK